LQNVTTENPVLELKLVDLLLKVVFGHDLQAELVEAVIFAGFWLLRGIFLA
jgi:hypothetical protein